MNKNGRQVYNFSSGPAILPGPVLERASEEIRSLGGIGMSVMEISHRSREFGDVLASARQGIADLLELPEGYELLFLQGGASLQFSMVPMNLLSRGKRADYVLTGYWGSKAIAEAQKLGSAHTVWSGEKDGFRSVPRQHELDPDTDAAYVHYTSNETIDGVEFDYELSGAGIPVVCDASSNILSKPMDIRQYALIYAGAQKNIGPSGVTVVVIRRDLLEHVPAGLPTLLDYRSYLTEGYMPNTPNTWGIYLIGLVADWLKERGGPQAMERRNAEKAAILYKAIDGSDGFYLGHAATEARSRMNVTFRLPTPELDERFVAEAESHGLFGLGGHRSVGGIRASIYNAFPKEGVERLVSFMSDFSARFG